MSSDSKNTLAAISVTLGYVRPLFDYVRKQGESLKPYLDLLGLSEADLNNADIRIADDDYDQLFRIAEQQLQDANIGLHVAQSMRFQHLGILGMLLCCCRYAHEVFDLQIRYQALVGNGLNTRYVDLGDEWCLESDQPRGASPYCRQSFDFSFGGWWQLKSQLVGDEIKLNRVELPYDKPADCSEHERIFDAPLSFSHDGLKAYFPAELADMELLASDPQLKQMLEAEARQRLAALQGQQSDAEPYLLKIKQLIAEQLAYGAPAAESIASRLETSVRTMQRQLDSHSSSYKALLDQVRADLAKKYIDNPDMSLLDMAMMLGFAEQSSFQRAFRRWFGDTPGGYRRKLQAELKPS